MLTSNLQRPQVGVAVLVWKGDYVLLGKRFNPQGEGEWQFPGGHLEVGETVTQCAVREVLEETGIVIAGMKHAGYTDALFSMNGREYVTLFVSAAYDSGEVRVMEPEKCQCWKWFQSNDLPTPLFGPITNLLKQIPGLNVLQVDQDIQAGAHK